MKTINPYTENKRQSKLCYHLHCDSPQIPLLWLINYLLIGIILGWLVFDYIHIALFGNMIWCVNGVHIHHLYIGILLTLIGMLLLVFVPNTNKTYLPFVGLMLGFGFGLILSDVFSHFILKDEIFHFWC